MLLSLIFILDVNSYISTSSIYGVVGLWRGLDRLYIIKNIKSVLPTIIANIFPNLKHQILLMVAIVAKTGISLYT